MAAFSESGPVFKTRCAQVGLAPEDVEKLEKVGVNSLAKVAFMTSYTPGSGDDKDLISAFEAALGTQPNVGQKSSFRRLFHEAYAVTTSEMRMLVERTDESVPRKLSVPERSERFEVVSKRLVGLSIRNRLEPADSLVDSFVSQYEQDRLLFVPWERLVSKEQEASTGAKREPVFSLDSSGKLRSETKVEVRADTSTELLLQMALQRRGIAMEMANILDYHVHHKWVVASMPRRQHTVCRRLINVSRRTGSCGNFLARPLARAFSSGRAGDRLIASSSKLGSHRKCFTCFSRCPALQVARHRLSWLHRQSCTGPARMRGRPRVARGQAKVRKAARAAAGSLRASLAAEPARMQARAFVLGMDSKPVARPSLVGAATEGCIYAPGHGVGNRARPWIVRSGRRLSARNKSDGQ